MGGSSQFQRKFYKKISSAVMPQIPQSTIDKIRDQADIVDVISKEVELKRKGVNYFGKA